MSREMEGTTEQPVSSVEEIEVYVSEKPKRTKRGVRGILTMEKQILSSKRWSRMCQKMGWTKPTSPRPVSINGRMKRFYATAGLTLEVSEKYYKAASRKNLRQTVIHELIHYALSDNGVYEKSDHGPKFEKAAVLMGIMKGFKYQWFCPCGCWMKTYKRMESVRCTGCHRVMVRKSELARLRRVAGIGSRIHPVDLSLFVEAKIKKL